MHDEPQYHFEELEAKSKTVHFLIN